MKNQIKVRSMIKHISSLATRCKPCIIKQLVIICFLSILVNPTHAQDGSSASNPMESLGFVLIAIGLLITLVVLLFVLYTLFLIRDGMLRETAEIAIAAGETIAGYANFWDEIKAKIAGLRPMEEEAKITLAHEYDGIRELDNHLPPWWTYLFYLTIIFGFCYILIYHVFRTWPLQEEEYNIQLVEAAEEAKARKLLAGATLDETSVVATEDPAEIENGKGIYIAKCAACHRNDGGGGVGPNLTDENWIHGGSISDIFYTIRVGVPQKGMISWESQLSPNDMRDVSTYIITLGGTNPPDAKGPQGEVYKP